MSFKLRSLIRMTVLSFVIFAVITAVDGTPTVDSLEVWLQNDIRNTSGNDSQDRTGEDDYPSIPNNQSEYEDHTALTEEDSIENNGNYMDGYELRKHKGLIKHLK
ncbi:uncharacterized protein LOC126845725 isoform X1 [Adelges cooleyi]|uniref:uncharacterized protein LOC126845725 isoform X1 n=1 Tax=Adelges cooleyi TaxID=133065 RepID=UPI00217F40C6|nr:uncharacterized protein LOC126845725 isoform X1 [Adelges cooleyi]XP_050440550.1 uncharacterized protein LOC126845725 isoform X1 [Adelges cooleyi]XP_050440559.1 uncharacterized protein LOC126845725 isoform X1 [Adelges cooleyi]